MGTAYELQIDPRVMERFPEYTALIIYATGLANGPSDEESVGLLRAAEQETRERLAGMRPADHPHIAAWRKAFSAFGAKPSKYPSSTEALLGRVLKGNELPAINRVVDIYNATSLRRALPVGGEDRDALASGLVLTFADGDEPFDVLSDGGPSHPEPGEVVWKDAAGVTCRRWNWRQGRRTMLTEETTNAYFVLDRLAPYPVDELRLAGEEFMAHLRDASPGVVLETRPLGAQS
jgi:DNA/RNA-binding domain of Phe-tRNA-synthetase-like protein